MERSRLSLPTLCFLYAAVAVTGVLGVGYTVVQQTYRTGLDDPQIQMAEDAAMKLDAGALPAQVVLHSTPPVDIGNSLSPWIAVYDQHGIALEATGQLHNAPPQLPAGVFDTSKWLAHANGLFYNQSPVSQNRFTWQPEGGVREAVVLAHTKNGKYVAAGRNMREVEQRIEHEGEIVFIGWLFTLFCLFVASVIAHRFQRA